MITIRIHKYAGIAFLVVAVLVAGAGLANAGSNDVVYYACANNSNGAMVLVATNEACSQNETRISWNSQGPQGLTGKEGVPGADGLHCWDINGNGIGDLRPEDRNGDRQVDALDCQVADSVWTTALAAETNARATTDAALAARVAELESLLVHFSREGDDVYIDGANLHVTNGTGATETTNSLGNIIIGYNETRVTANGGQDERSGSHMLVVGIGHDYSSYGGIVVGQRNKTSGPFAVVSGGFRNEASGNSSSISGGAGNIASGGAASITGGGENEARGEWSAVSGGWDHIAYGDQDWVAGDLFQGD